MGSSNPFAGVACPGCGKKTLAAAVPYPEHPGMRSSSEATCRKCGGRFGLEEIFKGYPYPMDTLTKGYEKKIKGGKNG